MESGGDFRVGEHLIGVVVGQIESIREIHASCPAERRQERVEELEFGNEVRRGVDAWNASRCYATTNSDDSFRWSAARGNHRVNMIEVAADNFTSMTE